MKNKGLILILSLIILALICLDIVFVLKYRNVQKESANRFNIIANDAKQRYEQNIEIEELKDKIKEYEAKLGKENETDNFNSDTAVTMKAIIVKADEDSLYVEQIDSQKSFLRLNLKDIDNTDFKMGQEILVYYDGVVLTIYPGEIRNIEKIEIINENSDIKIDDRYLRYCYSSRDNVEVSVNEITNKGIDIIIEDTNELQYTYANRYNVQKEVKNENYTGVGQTIGEITSNSTAGFTRNRVRIYL